MLGPLENADLVGTDLTLAIHQTVLPDIEHRPGPSPYLEKLVGRPLAILQQSYPVHHIVGAKPTPLLATTDTMLRLFARARDTLAQG